MSRNKCRVGADDGTCYKGTALVLSTGLKSLPFVDRPLQTTTMSVRE